MRLTKAVSPYQFAVFRIVFGLYLVIHFAMLLPYGAELFSREGVLPSARLNLTAGILPNPLEHWDTPAFVTGFLIVLLVLSLFYTLGLFRRTSAVLLWYGWACLFNRNNLISNPSIPYVGLLLLFTALLPVGEPLTIRRRPAPPSWEFPAVIFWSVWVLMAVGYTFSGCVKLQSPSWFDGTAMLHVVNNPLARPGPFRDLFLKMPDWAMRAATWEPLALEVLFVPLCLHRRTRMLASLAMSVMHAGILLMVDFADLSGGMLMLHLFTFDPDWLPARAPQSVVFYDGVCGLCDRAVQFLLAEDTHQVLRFAPLQGQTAQQQSGIAPDLRSIVLMTGSTIRYRSDAVLGALDEIGGFWRVVSWLRVIPRPWRNAAYDWVARHRYEWFGKFAECKLPTPELRARFLP